MGLPHFYASYFTGKETRTAVLGHIAQYGGQDLVAKVTANLTFHSTPPTGQVCPPALLGTVAKPETGELITAGIVLLPPGSGGQH